LDAQKEVCAAKNWVAAVNLFLVKAKRLGSGGLEKLAHAPEFFVTLIQ
jgi:hypothetical protein